MPALHQPLLIVTDLDGSLLDHHTYQWDAAADWLARLQQHQIPLVICSSKTVAEILPLQQKLGITGSPFIAENGAVVWLNDGHIERIPAAGKDYDSLCAVLIALQRRFRFNGFSDYSDREVAEITGLTPAEAALARQREASEAILWRDDDEKLEQFRTELERLDLTLTQGGRFWHVMPKGSGKGAALAWLLNEMQKQEGQRRQTLGLGDGPNDAPMLDSVDYAVVIKGYSKFPVTLTRQDQQNIYHTAHYGPQGWSEGLDYFLAQS
ncbi:mannosyl-3-phosphoglycerate phosphatase-related protein [Pantoea sp.]|uniref:mannosyl-3-phosphoglycerate phosphatase-related protein n=1 Tax=Pantoea sp. TaxID=69393 RepID=UPI00289A5E3B|nr:mannosyl-3-phosphoglycerate phosphatase-related protein [Pantoea sp.]